jgi:prepilin-type N-terminal cleavage/methylation domain-containing protein
MNLPQKTQRAARGFTLIELLVAMTAGLFVAIGAFALAKQGSRFFQQEMRVANAQFAATLGFDRMRADIARAGFLGTPNIQTDPFRCGDTTTMPVGMKSLAAVRLTRATPTEAQDTQNGLAPDRITLTGSYGSAEAFPVRAVVVAASGYQVFLQANTGSVARTNNGGADGGSMAQVFQAGRAIRILDSTGHTEFGRIDGYAVNADGQMVVSVHDSPALNFRKGGGNCGIEGLGVGMQANVINFIRYEVRNVKKSNLARYAPLYDTATASGPGDSNRLELIRVELDTDGNEIDDTLELVAEYAVDLRFGLTVVPSFRTPNDPDITSFPVGDSRIYNYAFDVGSSTAAGPERIRAVRARLVVRSREADRTENVPAVTAGNIFRYAVAGDAGFARARTLTADIALPNLTGVTW